jgi:hypothetical protein
VQCWIYGTRDSEVGSGYSVAIANLNAVSL